VRLQALDECVAKKGEYEVESLVIWPDPSEAADALGLLAQLSTQRRILEMRIGAQPCVVTLDPDKGARIDVRRPLADPSVCALLPDPADIANGWIRPALPQISPPVERRRKSRSSLEVIIDALEPVKQMVSKQIDRLGEG
jgi:hypothetical protein